MRILKEDTSAVIIDIQERLYPHIHNKEILSDNLVTLVLGLQVMDIPILVTQQYTKGLGTTIESVKEAFLDFSFIEKTAFSCCDEPSFQESLAGLGKKNVIIAGIETHICVLQTAVDLLEKGYMPILIEDCVSSRKEHDKQIAIERMRSEEVIVTTYESILFELCRYAGSDSFKNISRLVK